MEKLVIEVKPIGKNGLKELRNQLDKFVKENFDLLYEGAIRLGLNIPADYYAPRRVQINHTRLHQASGLKIADGHHKYHDDAAINEDQLRQTVADLQQLIDAAAENIKPPFSIQIIENEKEN